jgi:S-methylmethionine-dependent homocysteine/selenocysteine methylase
MVQVLDGALGTELEARGVDTAGAAWSARAIRSAPDRVAEIHAAYAAAGATIHTAGTFRTTRRALGPGWEDALRSAVALARRAVPAGHLVAGSLAPLEDCWHPERSPADPGPEHLLAARALADAGVDLILCETFAHVGEALAALDAALATGLPAWVSFSSGPGDDLLTPARAREGARAAAEAGAARVLVNCVPADRMERWVDAIARAGVPIGAYGNAGLGPTALSPEAYADHALRWVALGCTVVGGCCGTGPAHVRRVVERLS